MVDKNVIIAEQQEQIQQLTEQVIDLQKFVEKLRDKIARLEKNSSNSSRPPSSDIVDPQPRDKSKRKRRIGGQKGHRKHSRRLFSPDEIDKTVVHKLPDEQIKRRGLVELDETESALQQIDLPDKLFDVIDHRVQCRHAFLRTSLDSGGNLRPAQSQRLPILPGRDQCYPQSQPALPSHHPRESVKAYSRSYNSIGKCLRHRNPLEAIAAVGVGPWKQLKQTLRELMRKAPKAQPFSEAFAACW